MKEGQDWGLGERREVGTMRDRGEWEMLYDTMLRRARRHSLLYLLQLHVRKTDDREDAQSKCQTTKCGE